MFILCISFDGIVLRSVSVLYFLMVEKVESLLRGQWSAFNIYRAFSSSRLVGRLVRLVVASLSSRLVVLFRFCPCVLLVADAVAMSSVCRLMSGASRRGRLVSFLFVPFCSCCHPWRGGGSVWGVAGISLSSCGQGGGVLFPVFFDWLGGSGDVADGDAPFYSAHSYSHSRGGRVHGVMVSIWDEVALRRMITARA